MTNDQTTKPSAQCTECGSAHIEASGIVKHPTRIFYDVGRCIDCGAWLLWDGAQTERVAWDDLQVMLAEAVA